MEQSDYQRCLTSMYQLRRFGIKLELDTIRHLLAGLGNPQQAYQCIHIAGTNGKGSVAAMLATILLQAGYTVGRYTSPHLERFNERICINNQPIDDRTVLALYDAVTSLNPPERQPTFFEFTTAMALSAFKQKKVDWAVIETGMGGRMDATNVLEPAITVITNISLEHKAYLGDTIAAIAGEKAGIIKAKTPLVTAVQQKSARTVVLDTAAQRGAPAFLKGRDFRVRATENNHFSYYGLKHRWRDLSTSLHGAHQIDNASLALATCELLRDSGQATLDENHIRSGLKQTEWPGRLEVVADKPTIILDGAHNLMAVRVLANHLIRNYKNRTVTLVLGILEDKPFTAMLKLLAPACSRMIITQPVIERAIPVSVLEKEARNYLTEVYTKPSVELALRQARELSGPDDVICVAGSLYVVGEAKTALGSLDGSTDPIHRMAV
jgi:dihydrofolate synthase/folylpolyglutamate synthase